MHDSSIEIKTPPHSKSSEMMVLGSMLTSINALNVASGILNEEDFYYTEHKIIFNVLKEAYKQDAPADVHLVSEELIRIEKIKAVGGVGYLMDLAQYAGTSAHIEEYADLVKNKAMLRRMIYTAQRIEKDALDDPQDVITSLDKAQQMFFQIGQSSSSKSGFLLRDLLDGTRGKRTVPFLKALEDRQEHYKTRGPDDTGASGIATHFHELDKMINGMGESNLIILAARPAMGKTALGLNIASNVCFKSGKSVGVFSLEMNAEQLISRMICSRARIESTKLQTGNLSSQEYQQIVECVHEMKEHTFVIDDQPGMTITDLRARARRMREAYGVEMLVIDYLQLITGSSGRSLENRQNEISEISRMIKTLAREINIPIICLSQLSRKVEERASHIPVLSDLRESGSIEQDADVVCFLLRREYYDPMDKPGLADVIVAKNRHGSVGTVTLSFEKEFTQFLNQDK
jgi:replicative DNA helicase